MKVHPTAIIEEGASLHPTVVVGAYAYIGAQVQIGAGCEIRHHATVDGKTLLGERNTIHPYAYIGGRTQDLKYRGGYPGLRIGDDNDFREFCTVHGATFEEGWTIIGNANHFLAYTHVAHDCVLGNNIILSNNGTLAGHVQVGDGVVLGGLTAVHQFCRLGSYAMIGGCGKVVQDVPPFFMADGNPTAVKSWNKVGLERHGYSEDQMRVVRQLFKILYRDGLNRTQAMEKIRTECDSQDPVVRILVEFIQGSQRGIC